MRLLIALFIAMLSACTNGTEPQEFERIEMRLSGWSSVDVAINASGEGRWGINAHSSDALPNSFKISSEQFSNIIERMEPYRREAVPVSEATMMEFFNRTCPEGAPYVTDRGGFYVRWVSSQSDEHYYVQLGCDFEKHAKRNEQLMDVLKSLPIPLNI